jgi:hypothetical protein
VGDEPSGRHHEAARTVDVWLPALAAGVAPVLGSRFEFDLIADPAPQQDLDFNVGRRDLEDATLRGDFAAAQSAAAGFARHLFSPLPPVTVEGLRPLR